MPSKKQTYVKQIHIDTDTGLFLADYATISMSASIFSLKGLLENQKQSELKTALQNKFAINRRQASSIITFIEGEIKSAKESHTRHIKTLEGKIKSLKSSVDAREKKVKKHIEYLQAVTKYNSTKKQGKKAKIPSKYKPQFDEASSRAFGRYSGTYYQSAKKKLHHQKRKLYKMTCQLKYLKTKQLHVNLGNKETIHFVGSKDESNGNQVCQLILGLEKNSLDILKIRVPYALESRYGEYVEVPINLNGYGDKEIRAGWAEGRAITYRITQRKYGVWEAHITVDVYRSITSDSVMLGCIGVDLNIDSVAWCKVNADGNPKRFGEIKFNLHSLSHNQTSCVLASVVTELTTLALAFKCPIVIEELDFDAKKAQLNSGTKHKRYNRMISSFAYNRFYELLSSRCFKLGIKLITVNPAYSSLIGMTKFMSNYGMNSGTAAALVLARRAMNYSEGVPARTAYFDQESKKHVWSHWNRISKRVKGSARHSFFQPRPTASPSLRNGTTSNSALEFGNSVATLTNHPGGLNVPNEQTFASSNFERLECHLETDEGNRTTNRDCA
ncbi:hypothetical protein NIES4071_55040 [Calothrix sp. NIES-4071]|nr:hypothetical protein NIES4071_55040 [Calothrix sp. NIES-4071]BAZ59811.1 hypothetical protein NIES4105_54990 [Calothrix sp. NIES-4105]